MMEKAVLVRIDVAKAHRKGDLARVEALSELNEHLANGWQVKEARPTSGTNMHLSFSLVILTKED